MKLKLLFSLILTNLLISSPTLLAKDGQGYVGIGYGESDYDQEVLSKPRDYQFYLGNRYTKDWGIELGYTKFGEAETQVLSEDDMPNKIDGKTISLSFKYYIPVINRLDFYTQLGIHAWSLDLGDINLITSNDDSGTDRFYGAGLAYALTGKYRLTLGFSKYNMDVGNDNEIDLTFSALNFEWKTK